MIRRWGLVGLFVAVGLYRGHFNSPKWCSGPQFVPARLASFHAGLDLACEAFTQSPRGVIYTGCNPYGIRAIKLPSQRSILAVNTTGRVVGLKAREVAADVDEIIFCLLGEGLKSVKIHWGSYGPDASLVETVLTHHNDGQPISTCNALWLEDKTGNILFTDSSKLPMSEFARETFHKGSGRLSLYRRAEGDVVSLSKTLSFANGVSCISDEGADISCLVAATYDIGLLYEMKIDMRKGELVSVGWHDVGPLLMDNIHRLNETHFLIGAPGRMRRWQAFLNSLPRLPATDFFFSLTKFAGPSAVKAMHVMRLRSELILWDNQRKCVVENVILPEGANTAISEGFPIYMHDPKSQDLTLLLGSYGPNPISSVTVSL